MSNAAWTIRGASKNHIAKARTRGEREETRKVDIPRRAPVAGEDIAPVLDPVDLLPAEAGLVGTVKELVAIEIHRYVGFGPLDGEHRTEQIGRASCREREWKLG